MPRAIKTSSMGTPEPAGKRLAAIQTSRIAAPIRSHMVKRALLFWANGGLAGDFPAADESGEAWGRIGQWGWDRAVFASVPRGGNSRLRRVFSIFRNLNVPAVLSGCQMNFRLLSMTRPRTATCMTSGPSKRRTA